MCDCYEVKCSHPECRRYIPIHLCDFATKREEVEVFCGVHIPDDTENGVVWGLQKGDSVFIKPLTSNARANWSGNSLNAYPISLISVFGEKAINGVHYEEIDGVFII